MDIAELSRKHLEDAVRLGHFTLENQEVRQVTTSTILQLARAIVKEGLPLGDVEEPESTGFPTEIQLDSEGIPLPPGQQMLAEKFRRQEERLRQQSLDRAGSLTPEEEENIARWQRGGEHTRRVIESNRQLWDKRNRLVCDENPLYLSW
jgi:hypothetical protein